MYVITAIATTTLPFGKKPAHVATRGRAIPAKRGRFWVGYKSDLVRFRNSGARGKDRSMTGQRRCQKLISGGRRMKGTIAITYGRIQNTAPPIAGTNPQYER